MKLLSPSTNYTLGYVPPNSHYQFWMPILFELWCHTLPSFHCSEDWDFTRKIVWAYDFALYFCFKSQVWSWPNKIVRIVKQNCEIVWIAVVFVLSAASPIHFFGCMDSVQIKHKSN